MSRSYRRYPVVRQERVDKRQNNRKVRRKVKRFDFSLKGGEYKRLTIADDWHYIWTMEDAAKSYLEDEYKQERYASLEDYLNFWASCTIRK